MPRRRLLSDDQLLDAALDVFVRKGYRATTIQDICQAARCHVGSIYHRFPNKETMAATLFLTVARDFESELSERMERAQTTADMLEAYLDALLTFVEESPRESRYYTLFRPDEFESMPGLPAPLRDELRAVTGRLADAWRVLARRLTAECEGVTPDLAVAVALEPALAYGRRWLEGQASEPPSAFGPRLKRAVLRALGLR
jgi:AcrR family transcriptional regulator